MKFIKYKKNGEVKFRDGARLAWIGDSEQDVVIIRVLGLWFELGNGELTGSPDNVYANELVHFHWWTEV